MREVNQLFQAIVILIIGLAILGTFGMASFANQIGMLAILMILIAAVVIIFKIVIGWLDRLL